MSDAQPIPGWLAALAEPGISVRAETSREGSSSAAVLGHELVVERHARGRSRTTARDEQHEFFAFPGTGGGFVWLDANRPKVFRAGLELLPCGRALSRLATAAVGLGSSVGLAGWMGRERIRIRSPGQKGWPRLQARFPALPPDLAWNVASGVPGRDQKTILQLVRLSGEVVTYAKIGCARSARALVLREARVLDRLARIGVPAPLRMGLENGPHGALLVQSAVGGERVPGKWTEAHTQFQRVLARASPGLMSLEELPTLGSAERRLERLARRADADWLDVFGTLAWRLREVAGRSALEVAFAHGDFTPWNTRLVAGEIRAFDWEHARPYAPRLHDRLHFVLQNTILVERSDPRRALVELELTLTRDESRDFDLACALYVLDIATHDEEIQLERRSPFPQVAWVRTARLDLARALTQRLGSTRRRAA